MDLTDLDLAYAVSQQQLNGALAQALAWGTDPIEFAFANVGGNWVAATDEHPAVLTFEGTWAPVVDGTTGEVKVPMIDLSHGLTLDQGQVVLNLSFAAGATLTNTFVGRTYVQPDPAAPSTPAGARWTMPMRVTLSLAELEGKAPPEVQAQLAILSGRYGDIFSVQQVVADFSSLAPFATLSSSAPEGIDSTTWSFFQLCLGVYFRNAQSAGILPLASLITQRPATLRASPTAITPTAADFVVIPDPATPGLSALVFAMMSQGRALPGGARTLASRFSGVGFADANATGTLVVRSALLAEVITDALNASPVPAELSFYVACTSAPGGASPAFARTPDPDVRRVESVAPTPANQNQVACFDYSRADSGGSSGGIVFWSAESSVKTHLSATLTPSPHSETPSTVNVGGSIVLACSYNYNTPGVGDSGSDGPDKLYADVLPPTTFPWSAMFQLQCDVRSQGQIDFQVVAADFDTPPTTEGGGWWTHLWKSLFGITEVPDIDGVRTGVSAHLKTAVRSALVDDFASLQSFVLPGNNVFSFAGVFINPACNLVANMQYRDLGPATTGAPR
jgi:hypothetical protein